MAYVFCARFKWKSRLNRVVLFFQVRQDIVAATEAKAEGDRP
jgi:hypothetical protein